MRGKKKSLRFGFFCIVNSNVNNAESGQAVISGLNLPAFTTSRGRGDVREAGGPGYRQLALLRLITLGLGCQRWWGRLHTELCRWSNYFT